MRLVKDIGAIVIIVAFFLALGTSAVLAQSTAQINGTVRDQTGAVLPGVEVAATQTATGAKRGAITDETGSYLLTNLPIGPYMLEATLPGFKTYVQTGIVLQVDSNPSVNIVLQIGQISDEIEVQANAALVETRSTGVGSVIDNQRVLELPLNGRQATELIFLAGMATPGTGTAAGLNAVRNYPTVVIAIAGGIGNAVTYLLDGGNHNDPYNNLNLPLPFPDALQEFKVETSALPAQYGYHSSATVNAVTKSGTNQFHGDAFEFVRNGVFNARNFFAPKRDTLKRSQFGGVIGGPIKKDKLFFFAGYQGTVQRSDPPTTLAYVPTAAMLAGDFTTAASPACNGHQVTLSPAQGFTNNQISPSKFNSMALKIAGLLPVSADPCGKVIFGLKSNQDEHLEVGRIDYQRSQKNSMFARGTISDLNVPSTYDGKNPLTLSATQALYRIYSLALGDTYLINANTVSTFRASMTRSEIQKPIDKFYSWSSLGAQNVTPLAGETVRLTVSGNGFAIGSGNSVPNKAYGGPNPNLAEDISVIKGPHQIGFGANYIHTLFNFTSGLNPVGGMTFNSSVTNLPLADFLIGSASAWNQGTFNTWYLRQHYIAAYAQDVWKISPKLTLSYGVRWEPYIAPRSKEKKFAHFDPALFAQNVHSSVYVNAPAGMIFPGDAQYTVGNAPHPSHYSWTVPRIGIAWDPKGDARMTIRAAYGIFSDRQHYQSYSSFTQSPPYGNNIQLTNVTLSNPWGNYPGGNPFPLVLSKNIVFPSFGSYITHPFDFRPTYMNQWNLSLQRQIGNDWLASANYIGNSTIHLTSAAQLNPAVFLGLDSCALNGVRYPVCSTTNNTNQRRVLFLQNPAQGQFYSALNELDDGGTATYDGLLLSIQKRFSNGWSVQANHTWSHCISDFWEQQPGLSNAVSIPGNRRAFRSNCQTGDQRQVFNLSGVMQTPKFSNGTLRLLASDWQISPLLKARSAQFFSVTLGVDTALTGQATQAPNLVGNPYPAGQNVNNWISRSAFATPPLGSYGNLGMFNIKGPGLFQFDIALSRTFPLRERHEVQLRGEAFNFLNHANFNTPVATLNSGAFGQIQSAIDPRIMQFALKYIF